MVEKPALRPGVGETLLGDYGLLSEVQKDPIGPLWVGRRAGETDARALVLVRPLVVDQLAGDGIVEELEQAAGWARLLEHEALLPVVDFVSEDDKLAIVSQYVEGELLSVLLFRANLRRQHFPVAVVLRIVLDVLEGLAFLHEQLDAPSDLYRFGTASPEGIYVGLDGRARIIEPGVSAVLAQVDAWGGDAKRLAYRAPEQLDDAGELGPTTDVFTAGAILWEMLGKRRLIAGSSAEVIAKNLVEQPIPRVDSLKGPGIRAITEELASVVAQALERATDQRLSSVQALASAVRGAGAKVGDHEEVARYVDELHGQTLLERHRKIEQAFTAPRASGPGRGAASSPGAGSKPAVAAPQPFAATPSSKGDDDGEPGSLTADAPAEEPEAEPSPKREIPAPKAKKKPPATSQEAPPPPKRRKGPPRKRQEPPPEGGEDPPAEAQDDAASSRKESAVVTMRASRSQLARRRRPSTDTMKAALPGNKKQSVKPPPRRAKREDQAEELDGATAPDTAAEDGELKLEGPADSAPGRDAGKPAEAAEDSAPGADEAAEGDTDVADEPSQPDGDEESAKAPVDDPEAEEPKKAEAKEGAKGKPSADAKPTGSTKKDKKGAKAQDDRRSKPAAKGATAATAASAKEPVEAADLEVEEPKSRWPMMAALAALVAAVVIVFAMRSGSDDTSPAPGAGSPSARPSPVPPPGPTGEPRPSATEPAVTGDEPAPEPPPPTTAAPATSPAPPLAEPTVAPKPPAPPKTAPTVAPKPPKPPPPKPPPVKPPPPKPPGEFDPGGI